MKKIFIAATVVFFALMFLACVPVEQLETHEVPDGQAEEALRREINMTMSMALEFYKNRQYDDAIPLFRRVIDELEPDNATAWRHLAYSYLRHDDESYTDSALVVFHRALDRYSDRVFPYAGIAHIYMAAAEFDSARHYYSQAVVLDTTNVSNIRSYANLLLRDVEYDSAIVILELGTRQDPDNNDIWERLTTLYRFSGDDDKLVNAFANLHRINPDDPSYLLELGQAYARRGEDDRAIEMLENYVLSNPTDFRGYRYLGNVQSLQGRFSEAAKNLEKAIELDPENPRLHCDYAQILTEQGQLGAASRCIATARRLEPNFAYSYIAEGDLVTRQAYDMVSPEGELDFCTKEKFDEAYNIYRQVANDERWGPIARGRMRRIQDYRPSSEERAAWRHMGGSCD